jgi:carboxyl-terminal processing protease
MIKPKYLFFLLFGIFFSPIVKAQQTDFFEVAKQLEIYASVMKQLDMYYIDPTHPAELNDVALKSLLKSLDPYTNFYDEQGIEDVRIRRSGEYGGIGASTRFKDNRLFIREVYEETPAASEGLKAGDEILQIDDVVIKDYEDKSVSGLLRGLPDTKVQLKILRGTETMTFDVARSKIEMKSVPFWGMVDDEVGYIAFIKFNRNASTEVKSAYAELKSQGMKKLILDLRGNPGGLLKEAIYTTNFFIPKGKIVVTTKAKVKKWSNTYKTRKEPIDLEIPIVILINGRSASASEIVSGSLQDYDRAVIMGERSFGKGLVQRYRDLPYNTKMKLTISKYYTPSGRCIQELDYTNKDENGDVPKFSDGKVNTFTTTNGRKVTDGGGVLPDVLIDKPETLKLTKYLFNSDAFFNFITQYTKNHPTIATATDFQLPKGVYESLMTYLRENPQSFETKWDTYLKDGMKAAEKEGFKEEITSDFEIFQKAVVEQKIKKLNLNRKEIEDVLTEEIVRRYYYRSGEYEQKMAHDPVIVQAKDLLHDTKQYEKILK